ncbi:MAG: AraC family transcriptional regulator, partial [Methylococcaceae bacterium]
VSMTITTNYIAKTTISNKINDVFSETLGFLKISGNLLLNEDYSSPWAISVPDKKELSETLGKKNVHIAAFHLVQRGYIEIELENGNKELVREGEFAICFGGAAHTLFQEASKPARCFKDIMQGGPNTFEPTKDNYAQSTSLICGIFILHDTTLNPLFEALPPLLKISPGQENHYSSSTTANIINLLLKEISHQSFVHDFMIERYLELLCAKSIHAYIETAPSGENGWLHAIKDPKIALVISAIHAQPAYLWSVKELAKLVSLSPSRFAARFTEIMDTSPMIYVTRWRMYLASKLLNDTRLGIDLISSQVGYDNVAAFSRAFKRNIGSAPGVWRTDNRTL